MAFSAIFRTNELRRSVWRCSGGRAVVRVHSTCVPKQRPSRKHACRNDWTCRLQRVVLATSFSPPSAPRSSPLATARRLTGMRAERSSSGSRRSVMKMLTWRWRAPRSSLARARKCTRRAYAWAPCSRSDGALTPPTGATEVHRQSAASGARRTRCVHLGRHTGGRVCVCVCLAAASSAHPPCVRRLWLHSLRPVSRSLRTAQRR